MADFQRLEAASLIEALRDKQCCGYDFFSVVRRWQAARPDLPLIGCSKTPDEDPVRFCQHPSLAFAPSTLDELVVDAANPGKPPRLFVNFMGLFGPNGPLPFHLTEFAIRRHLGHNPSGSTSAGSQGPLLGVPGQAGQYVQKDDALADFCDIFHHRLISLFFRAWAVAQPTVDLDRSDHQRFLFFLGAFAGASNNVPEDHRDDEADSIPWSRQAFYVGRLACPSRNAEGLEAILRDFFALPARVREFVGRWFELPEEDQCQLGRLGSAWRLGQNVFVGSRTWAVHLGIRLRLGPMVFDDYLSFLPGGSLLPLLKDWVAQYCGVELFWDLQLVLLAPEVPDTILGKSGRLGWTTWLKTKPLASDPDDLILQSA